MAELVMSSNFITSSKLKMPWANSVAGKEHMRAKKSRENNFIVGWIQWLRFIEEHIIKPLSNIIKSIDWVI
jgi:hypothetical protein